MNKFVVSVAVGAMSLAVPAFAAVPLFDSPTVAITAADVGKSFTYDFTGFVNDTEVADLTSSITFTFTGESANVWTFSALIDNSVSVTPVGGRLTGFGFSGTPEITGVTPLSGIFGVAVTDAKFPGIGGNTIIDFCLTAQGNNCQGSGSGGLADGSTTTQTFSLTFAQTPVSVVFNDFIVRYQDVTGVTAGTSGIGLGEGSGGFDGGGGPGVPEPASWAMLIAGFGLVGAVSRRRKASGLTVAA
jgi:hypothetical protein